MNPSDYHHGIPTAGVACALFGFGCARPWSWPGQPLQRRWLGLLGGPVVAACGPQSPDLVDHPQGHQRPRPALRAAPGGVMTSAANHSNERVELSVRPQVRVGVERRLRARVPEPGLGDLHIGARGDEDRRQVVPQVVVTDRRRRAWHLHPRGADSPLQCPRRQLVAEQVDQQRVGP